MRRTVQVGVIGLGVVCLAVSVLTTVGAEHYCTSSVIPRIEQRLGAMVTVADVAAMPGRIVLQGVAVTPRGAAAPLVVVRSVELRYSIGSLLSERRVDSVTVRGVNLSVEPTRGLVALRDLLARARHGSRSPAARPGAAPRELPAISFREVRVTYDDPAGLHILARLDAALGTYGGRLLLRGLKVSGQGEPAVRVRAATVDVSFAGAATSASLQDPTLVVRWRGEDPELLALADRARAALELVRGGPQVAVTPAAGPGGAVRIDVHRGRVQVEREDAVLSLVDIHGWVAPDPMRGSLALRLKGRVGDEAASWEVEGEGDPATASVLGHVQLTDVPLPLVLPHLPRLPVDWTAATRLSARLDLRYDHTPGRLGLEGDARAEGLTITAPMVASEPLRDLDVTLSGKAAVWLRSEELAVSDARVAINGIPVLVHGDVARSGGRPRVTADLSLPPTPCGALLRSMPTALVAHLGGMRLDGTFGADLHVVVDMEQPDRTDVRFDVGNECRLLAEDFARVDRLRAPFVQRAVSAGQNVEFVTGPGSPGWTSYDELSPHLIGAVLTTEDGGFFSHSGFSADSIRRAIVRDLREGRFAVGGSTISMQLTKNLFLGHEKTIARKVQEAVLTWMLEQSMRKDEILELYFNVIEYGPGLYGIRNATRHFFGVSPSELTPIQAVYIATLLPSPVHRYATFLRGTPTPALMERLHRILRLMAQRGHLEGSLEEALAEPLTFRGGNQIADAPAMREEDDAVQ